jgi:hypothetical protein
MTTPLQLRKPISTALDELNDFLQEFDTISLAAALVDSRGLLAAIIERVATDESGVPVVAIGPAMALKIISWLEAIEISGIWAKEAADVCRPIIELDKGNIPRGRQLEILRDLKKYLESLRKEIPKCEEAVSRDHQKIALKLSDNERIALMRIARLHKREKYPRSFAVEPKEAISVLIYEAPHKPVRLEVPIDVFGGLETQKLVARERQNSEDYLITDLGLKIADAAELMADTLGIRQLPENR